MDEGIEVRKPECCIADGCEEDVYARNLCSKHYQRWQYQKHKMDKKKDEFKDFFEVRQLALSEELEKLEQIIKPLVERRKKIETLIIAYRAIISYED